jgi:hypothetical protein
VSREYRFEIEIQLKSPIKKKKILDCNVSYPFSQKYQDHFIITSDLIRIEAYRSQKLSLESIFFNYNSAINRQITKALTYYYCALGHACKIKKITVIRLLNDTHQDQLIIEAEKIIQIVDKNSNLSDLKKLDLVELKAILEEDDKGHSILIAATHLIKACSFSNPFEKFDRLWKSFNALYKQLTSSTTDRDCLIKLRQHMDANPTLYLISLTTLSTLTADEIRKKIRWVAMLHNDFPTEKKTEAFKEFVLRVEDERFIYILKNSLTIREVFLKNAGFYNQVLTHINNKTLVPVKNDVDVLAILCLKYMYFVRNKTFHAEKLDSSFNIVPNGKEEQELDWLAKILKMLIIDMINFNSKF